MFFCILVGMHQENIINSTQKAEEYLKTKYIHQNFTYVKQYEDNSQKYNIHYVFEDDEHKRFSLVYEDTKYKDNYGASLYDKQIENDLIYNFEKITNETFYLKASSHHNYISNKNINTLDEYLSHIDDIYITLLLDQKSNIKQKDINDVLQTTFKNHKNLKLKINVEYINSKIFTKINSPYASVNEEDKKNIVLNTQIN